MARDCLICFLTKTHFPLPPTDPDLSLVPEVHADLGWMIIVVAESEDACNNMTGPAEFENVVEKP